MLLGFMASACVLTPPSSTVAQSPAAFIIEAEAGPLWQSRNTVQIPNDASGTRFSLVDLVGTGPQPTGRLYLTWNINARHGLRALVAPLSFTETGTLTEPANFAGERYQPNAPVAGTYKFNSWRLSYRYRLVDRERLTLFLGFTAKIRDAKVELQQDATSSKKTDVGFVPLLHSAAEWQLARRWAVHVDFDGLAGGPGRAFDVAVKLGYGFGNGWRVAGGYRTVEGGADVDSVYSFAWLHYAVGSITRRF